MRNRAYNIHRVGFVVIMDNVAGEKFIKGFPKKLLHIGMRLVIPKE